MPAWLVSVIVAVVLTAAQVLLTPRPKQPKPPEVRNLEDPTAEAGRPVLVVFGTIKVMSPNVLWSGDKATKTYQVNA